MPRPRLVDDGQLLNAAMFAFWERGYGGVTTRDLEEATRLPASSLYHRHGSKEGVFVAALAHYLERVLGWRVKHFLEREDAFAGLREFYTSVYRTAKHPYNACLLVNTAADANARSRDIDAVLARGRDELLRAFAENLARGIAQGHVRADVEPAKEAHYLLAFLNGLLLTARHQRDFDKLDAIVDTALRAVAAPANAQKPARKKSS